MKDIVFGKIEIKAFGGLKNKVFDMKPGVNTAVADNGTGKSTLASFIKFIFYGFSGSRLAGIIGNERNMYIPWDSNFVEGSIDLTCSKGEFRVARYFCKPSKETVTITELSTGKQVLGGVVPGEYFFGIGEDTFVKTAFFYSLRKTKNGDSELAQQLENLVFSADELTSYASAADRLNAARTSIVNRQNRGVLPDTRQKLTAVENDLYTATAANDEITEITKALRQKKLLIEKRKQSLEELNRELENIEKFEAKKQLDRVELAREASERAQKSLTDAEHSLGGEIPDATFVERLTADNNALEVCAEKLEAKRFAIGQIESEIEAKRSSCMLASCGLSCADIEKNLKKKNSACTVFLSLAVLFGVVFAALAVLVYVMEMHIDPMINLAVAGLCGIMVIALIISLIARSSFAKKNGYSSVSDLKHDLKTYPALEFSLEKLNAELEAAHADAQSLENDSMLLTQSLAERLSKCTGEEVLPADFARTLTRIVDGTSGALLVKNDYIAKKSVYDFTVSGVDLEALKTMALGADEPKRSKAEVMRDISIITMQIDGLNTQYVESEKKILQLKEHPHVPSALEAQREVLQTRIDTLEDKKKAYELAMAILEKSSTYMRSSISPQLTSYATEYFCEASNFEYSSLGIDTNLNLSFGLGDAQRDADFLSDGTRDTAYLCVRLALMKMICRNGRPPVVLDDAFGHLDRKRLGAMLSVLTQAMDGGQTLILTCRGDELAYFAEKGVKLSIIDLK